MVPDHVSLFLLNVGSFGGLMKLGTRTVTTGNQIHDLGKPERFEVRILFYPPLKRRLRY